MNKLLRLTIATVFSILVFTPALASADVANWKLNISSPYSNSGGISNSRKFNLSISAISNVASDVLTVDVYDNATQIGSTLTGDTNTTFGMSWTVPVSLSTDGTHVFKAVAHNSNGDPDQERSVNVTVDTSAPASPIYKGSTRSGNKITVTFSAPANADVTTIKIFSSTKPSFSADDSTLVGALTIGPGETKSFTFTVDSAATRYTAVQAFDSAGNGSALVGDPQTNATSAAQTTNGSSTSTANDSASQNGQVKSDKTDDKESKGSKSNDSDNKDSNKDWIWWVVIVLLVVGLAGAYVRYMRGEDDNSFWPKSKK